MNEQKDTLGIKSAKKTFAIFRREKHENSKRRLRRLNTVVVSAVLLVCTVGFAYATDQDTGKHTSDAFFAWGLKWKHLLGPSAILVSALGSWILIFLQMRNNRDIAKKRATFDYLSRLSWDNDFLEQRKKFLGIRASDKKMASVATTYEQLKSSDEGKEEEFSEALTNHTAVKTILNEYEAIAVGIFTKTLDEEMVRRNFRQQIIDAVTACDEFIAITRKNSTAKEPSKIYCECQNLVKKWKNGS